MKKFLLNIYYWPSFIVLTIVGIGVLPFILLYSVTVFSRKTDATLRRAIRLYGWVLVRLVPFFAPVSIKHNSKSLDLPAVFVANHNSAIDPYLFGMLAIENSFVTSWPFKIPVYRYFMKKAGYANTNDGWEEVRKKGRKLLDAGCSVTIWPEGHRSRNGRLNRFKRGAFTLAVEANVPIIPVCILGSGKVLPPGKMWLNPGRVELIVLDPLYPEKGNVESEVVGSLRLRARASLEAALRQNDHFSEGIV